MTTSTAPTRTALLQTLRLKGRALPSDLPADPADVDALVAGGLAEEARGRLKLTQAGKAELARLLDAERADLDGTALAAAYAEFDEHNTGLKRLMTRWQLVDESTPNDHTDAAYDQAVVDDLVALDAGFAPLLARVVALAPRLGTYPPRVSHALAQVRAGDRSWFARPLVDSYHTVWFELHEELIGLSGRTRADEAAAGRAL